MWSCQWPTARGKGDCHRDGPDIVDHSSAPMTRRFLIRLRYSAGPFALLSAWQALRSSSLEPLYDVRAVRTIGASGLFDRAWYLERNPDVARWGIDPVRHYVAHGAREARDPGPIFNASEYLARHPVPEARRNPLLHYLMHQTAATDGVTHTTAPQPHLASAPDGAVPRQLRELDLKQQYRQDARAALKAFLSS